MNNSQRKKYLNKINKMKPVNLIKEIGRLRKWVKVNIEQRSVHDKIFRKDIQMRIDEINILLEQIKERTEAIFKNPIHPNRLLELKDKLEKAKTKLAVDKAAKKWKSYGKRSKLKTNELKF